MGGLAAAKGLAGFFGSRGRDKAAKAEARNRNKMNRYQHKFKSSEWEGERGWQQRKRGRSHSYRSQFLAALMGNPKYGLSKLFPGFAQLQKQYTPGDKAAGVINPHEAAGPPPELEAAQGGVGAGLAAGIGGAADVAGQVLPHTKWG
jgi:hypothetical protein